MLRTPSPVISGSFSSRMYTFYAGLGDKIARVSRGQEAFRDVDTYQAARPVVATVARGQGGERMHAVAPGMLPRRCCTLSRAFVGRWRWLLALTRQRCSQWL